MASSDKVAIAQRQVDETKSLMEDSIASMANNVNKVETEVLPSATMLAIEGKEVE